MRHAGQVLSRQQILSTVWDYEFDPGSNVVDVYVSYLRNKLGHRGGPSPPRSHERSSSRPASAGARRYLDAVPFAGTRRRRRDMATAERRANVVWRGDLAGGSGSVDLASSEVARGLPVTWASRTERPDGKTSPEELIAAAHASCYAMALSGALAKMGNEPEQLDISAVCTFDADQLKVTTVVLDVRGRVPGLDAEGFQSAAEQAEQGCPVSNALRGNVDIQLNATLE
jgi:lipoyl-dependent peroxiredoxin